MYQEDRKHITGYFSWLIGTYRQRTKKAKQSHNESVQKLFEMRKKLRNGQHVTDAELDATAQTMRVTMASEYINGELLLTASNMEVMMNYMITTSENVEDLVKTVNNLVSELQKVKSLPEQFKHQLSEITSKVDKHEVVYDSLHTHIEKQKKAHEENQKKFDKSSGDIYG
jgi:chromosome segregation ATPase